MGVSVSGQAAGGSGDPAVSAAKRTAGSSKLWWTGAESQ